MLTVESGKPDDLRTHLASPGSITTLCGLVVGRVLPFVPAQRFGIAVTLESGEVEYDWCKCCGRRKPRSPSYDATQQRYWKEEKALAARGVLK
jgi:hypothetical protein